MNYNTTQKEVATPATHPMAKDMARAIFNEHSDSTQLQILKDIISELLFLRSQHESERSVELKEVTENYENLCKGNAFLTSLNNL